MINERDNFVDKHRTTGIVIMGIVYGAFPIAAHPLGKVPLDPPNGRRRRNWPGSENVTQTCLLTGTFWAGRKSAQEPYERRRSRTVLCGAWGRDFPRLTRLSASVKGVKASANLYSLIETAKANGLEPYAYLRHLFTELPKAETVEAIEALLPGNLSKDQIRIG